VMDDFNWHQTKFRAFLEERQLENLKALKMVERQHDHVKALLKRAEKSKSVPDWQAAAKVTPLRLSPQVGWATASIKHSVR